MPQSRVAWEAAAGQDWRQREVAVGVSKLVALIGGFHLSGPAFEPVIGPTVAALTELAPELIVPGAVEADRLPSLRKIGITNEAGRLSSG
ncbi:hypothetical protein ABT115_28385 [Streptomyces sp. NPDC001832]|uniref:hypothetical protein n=1 Tax=Streptomyces sp. NPDC001832 TaxID=3154527 RepID=UPI0033290E12